MRHRRTDDACCELLTRLHPGWTVVHRDGHYIAKRRPDEGALYWFPLIHPDPVRLSELIHQAHDEIQRRRLAASVRRALPRRHPGVQREGPRLIPL